MLDPDIYGLFNHTDNRAEELGPDLEKIALALGYSIEFDDLSAVNHWAKRIHIDESLSPEGIQSDLAHELGHCLAREGLPRSWAEVIARNHASVPDLHAHREALTNHQGDRLTMPRTIVQTVLNICGFNARAVWVLHQQQKVYLHEALRRIVCYNENARVGGFIAKRDRIIHAYSYRYRLPIWVGDLMPDPDYEFRGDCVSLFEVPGMPETFIGLVVIEE